VSDKLGTAAFLLNDVFVQIKKKGSKKKMTIVKNIKKYKFKTT